MSLLVTKEFTVEELQGMGNPKNPRWMPDAQMKSLVASLTKFGLVEPIIVNIQTNHIVGGHQRVAAAETAGLKTIEAVIVDLSPEKELALNLSLNKIKGDWDYDKLGEILATVNREDITLTGFSELEVEAIVESARENAAQLEELGGGDILDDDNQNQDEEGIEQILDSTIKVQFGMFSKIVDLKVYDSWVEGLKAESTEGDSPAALGLVIAKRLGLVSLEYEEGEEDEEYEDEEYENEEELEMLPVLEALEIVETEAVEVVEVAEVVSTAAKGKQKSTKNK